MKTHKNLEVWQHSIELVVEIYRVTSKFPQSEQFGLGNQMRRSAISIPSNIAEGAGRLSTKQYIHYLKIAFGSLTELETQVIIAGKLGYSIPLELLDNITRLQKQTYQLLKYLRNSIES